MSVEILLAICLFLIGSCSGILFSKKYSNRLAFYKSLRQFNCDFLNELSYTKKTIGNVLSKKYVSQAFNELLVSFKLKIGNQNASELKLPKFCNETEIIEINSYFENLGGTDYQTQRNILLSYETNFLKKVQDAIDENAKYGSLLKKTGVVIGLIAFVIAV